MMNDEPVSPELEKTEENTPDVSTNRPENKPPYQNVIAFKQKEVITIQDEATLRLLKTHGIIIYILRMHGPLTVKEITEKYNLFIKSPDFPISDMNDKKEKSDKTIYRYIAELTKAGIVTEAGYRKTEGTHITEKLYCRTARIFLLKSLKSCDEEEKWWFSEEGNNFTRLAFNILINIFGIDSDAIESFKKTIMTFSDTRTKISDRMVDELTKHQDLSEKYIKDLKFDQINHLIEFIGTIGIIIDRPDLVNELQMMFTKAKK